ITEGGLAMDQEPHSLEFDGDDDYVDLETDFYDPQTFSWAFWVNPDELDEDGDNNYRRIITSSDSAANIILIEENGDVSFRVPGVETDNFKAGNVPLNDWAHVVCVYDQSDRIIYVNGNEDDRENIGSGTVDFPPIQLVHPGSQTFDGNIDDVRLYDRALTPSEISGLFGGQDIMDGLVGWWPMDEGEGDLAYDYSGNRNHGTIYGASWSTDTPFAYLPTGGSEAEISWSEGSDLAPFDIEPVDIDEKPMAIDSQIVPPTKETDRDN
ncbi:MAG: LamG domain-containing protein, partial [Candidatus Aenigmatarchaeota archaeon]